MGFRHESAVEDAEKIFLDSVMGRLLGGCLFARVICVGRTVAALA